MLNVLRQGAKSGIVKFSLFGLLLLAVCGLVLTDAGGFSRQSSVNVARVGGDNISIMSFDSRLRQVLSAQGMDTATAYRLGMVDQLLYSEINQNLLLKSARDLGLEVSDRQVATQIAKVIAPFVDRNATREQAFQRILRSQNMTEHQFVETVRAEMASTILRNALILGGNVPSAAYADDLYKFRNEQRMVDYIALPASLFPAAEAPTDEALSSLYEERKSEYAVPEQRTLSLLVLSPGDIAKADIDEADLRAYYQDHLTEYAVPEQRILDQAVLASEDEAKKVISAMKDEKDLKTAVLKATGSDDAYIGKDDFKRDSLPKEVAEPVFSGRTGDRIGPIQTPLGWHVFVVTGIQAAATQPFESVKSAIAERIAADRTAESLADASARIDDALAAGDTLEQIGEQEGIPLRSLGPVRADGSLPSGKAASADHLAADDLTFVLQTAFELNEEEVSPVVELSTGGYAAIRADKIEPLTYRPFEAVRGELEKSWTDQEKRRLQRETATALLGRLQKKEIPFSAAAAEVKVPVKSATLTRGGELAAPFTDQGRGIVFSAAVPGYVLQESEDGYVLAFVKALGLPETKTIQEPAREEIKNAMRQGGTPHPLL